MRAIWMFRQVTITIVSPNPFFSYFPFSTGQYLGKEEDSRRLLEPLAMSVQPESKPAYVEGFAYTIGSKSRSLLRFGILLVIILNILILHYFFLRMLTDLALPVLILSWLFVPFRCWRYLPGWVDFLLKDSAYGTLTADGIHYRVILRSQFIPWSSVARVEYSPLDSGRLSVFRIGRHSFSRVRPLSFAPWPAHTELSNEIKKILRDRREDAKFVTTDQISERFLHL
jgi:hypothetical protein